MIRAFIAIDLPEDVVEALERLQSDIPAGRIVPAENLHLTVAFLGEQPPQVLEELHGALELAELPGFDLGISGLGTMGGRSPRILHANVTRSHPLTRLHRKVRRLADDAGIGLPRERFRPHITLARFPRELPRGDRARLDRFLAANAGFRLDPFRATAWSLVRSTLDPSGARHEVLARYDLV